MAITNILLINFNIKSVIFDYLSVCSLHFLPLSACVHKSHSICLPAVSLFADTIFLWQYIFQPLSVYKPLNGLLLSSITLSHNLLLPLQTFSLNYDNFQMRMLYELNNDVTTIILALICDGCDMVPQYCYKYNSIALVLCESKILVIDY